MTRSKSGWSEKSFTFILTFLICTLSFVAVSKARIIGKPGDDKRNILYSRPNLAKALENFFLLSLADKERTSAVQYLFPAAGHKVARNKGRGPQHLKRLGCFLFSNQGRHSKARYLDPRCSPCPN